MERSKGMGDRIKEDNYKIFALLGNYLNQAPDFIEKEEMDEMVTYGVSYEHGFAVLLAAAFGLDIVDHVEDKDLFNNYFNHMIHHLDTNEYDNNPYYEPLMTEVTSFRVDAYAH